MKHPFKEGVLDALIAAAVTPGLADVPPSGETIERFIALAATTEPTAEDLEVLRNVSQRLDDLLQGKPSMPRKLRSSAFMMSAMNRKHGEEVFSDETESALDAARRAAIENLLKEQEGESDDH
jgi:hypothetical protein